MECRGPNCNVIIKWIKNEQGKPVPCDSEPIKVMVDDRGPVIAYTSNGAKIRGEFDPLNGVLVYQAHHQTCPDVKQFRRKN